MNYYFLENNTLRLAVLPPPYGQRKNLLKKDDQILISLLK